MRRHASPRRAAGSRAAITLAVAVAAGLAGFGTFGMVGVLPDAPGPLGEVLDVHVDVPDVAGADLEPTPRPSGGSVAGPRSGPPTTRTIAPPPIGRLGEPPVLLRPDQLTGYRWPLARGRITLKYGPLVGGSRVVDGGNFHDGIDLATFCGDRVLAAHDGIVLAAGRRFDDQMGWVGDLRPYYRRLDAKNAWSSLPIVVVIDDGNGYRSIYAHFRDVVVKPGQRVGAGDLLGHEGRTGHASGCHVHYGLFSPRETALFGIRADVVKRMKVPDREIARIDPTLVMPDGEAAVRLRRFPVPAPTP